ncbi:hypothetical protein AF332_20430 [Sporosarcina globispora]|uniref:Uncharacterized protein n=1 Tax=Sporosarcina globispora TaxID=1459 RepID=A0A0M0GGC8_SPOGL|nr:hypothetical protein AF332_20430 [Sporosarcina globispora]
MILLVSRGFFVSGQKKDMGVEFAVARKMPDFKAKKLFKDIFHVFLEFTHSFSFNLFTNMRIKV